MLLSHRTAGVNQFSSSASHAVYAPLAAADRGEIEEQEAIKRGGLAPVRHGPEKQVRAGVGHPERHRHHSGENESRRTRIEAHQQQQSADHFEQAGQARNQRHQFVWRVCLDGEAEHFLCSVLHEHEGGKNPQDAEQFVRMA